MFSSTMQAEFLHLQTNTSMYDAMHMPLICIMMPPVLDGAIV